MGWANCGKDSRGRWIGYAHSAKCDERGCKERIDRGLSYACGGMHGNDGGCEGYFCAKHLFVVEDPFNWLPHGKALCAACKNDHNEILVDELISRGFPQPEQREEP